MNSGIDAIKMNVYPSIKHMQKRNMYAVFQGHESRTERLGTPFVSLANFDRYALSPFQQKILIRSSQIRMNKKIWKDTSV